MANFTQPTPINRASQGEWQPPEGVTPARPPAAGKGFVQTFGLDVRVAALAVIIDFMAFTGDIVSAGLLYPVEILSGVALTFITYKIQRA